MTSEQNPRPAGPSTGVGAGPAPVPGASSTAPSATGGSAQTPSAQGGAPAGPPSAPPGSSPSPGGWQPGPVPPSAAGVPRGEAGTSAGTWIAGLALIAIGGLLLLGRWVPDAGQYVVLAVGLVFLAVFFATGEYGFLIPGGIVSGVGAGIPLSIAYPGELGGGLFLVSLGMGFLLIWGIGLLFRVREHHWWPLVPGLLLGTIGASLAAGERGQGVADAISTGWPVILVIAGLILLAGAFRRRPA